MDSINQREKASREIANTRVAILLGLIVVLVYAGIAAWIAFRYHHGPTVFDLLVLLVLSCLVLAPLYSLSRAKARLEALGGPVPRRGAARRSAALARRSRRTKTIHRLR